MSSKNQKSNVYLLTFLGKCSLNCQELSPDISELLQTSLFNLYTNQKSLLKLPQARVTLNNNGLIIAQSNGEDDFYSLENVVSCTALTFIGFKIKTNKKKSYSFNFADIKSGDPQKNQESLTPNNHYPLPKKLKNMVKLQHPPLIVFINKKMNLLEMNAFICENSNQALSIKYSTEMACRFVAEEKLKQQNIYGPVVPPIQDPNSIYGGAPTNPNIGNEPNARIKNPNQSNNNNNKSSNFNSGSTSQDADLPEVIRRLEKFGVGRGSVVNPVVKTTNINLINNEDLFKAPNINNLENNMADSQKNQTHMSFYGEKIYNKNFSNSYGNIPNQNFYTYGNYSENQVENMEDLEGNLKSASISNCENSIYRQNSKQKQEKPMAKIVGVQVLPLAPQSKNLLKKQVFSNVSDEIRSATPPANLNSKSFPFSVKLNSNQSNNYQNICNNSSNNMNNKNNLNNNEISNSNVKRIESKNVKNNFVVKSSTEKELKKREEAISPTPKKEATNLLSNQSNPLSYPSQQSFDDLWMQDFSFSNNL